MKQYTCNLSYYKICDVTMEILCIFLEMCILYAVNAYIIIFYHTGYDYKVYYRSINRNLQSKLLKYLYNFTKRRFEEYFGQCVNIFAKEYLDFMLPVS